MRRLTQRQHDIVTQNNAALAKMLKGSITEQAYRNYIEPTTRELEQMKSSSPNSRRSTERWKNSQRK